MELEPARKDRRGRGSGVVRVCPGAALAHLAAGWPELLGSDGALRRSGACAGSARRGPCVRSRLRAVPACVSRRASVGRSFCTCARPSSALDAAAQARTGMVERCARGGSSGRLRSSGDVRHGRPSARDRVYARRRLAGLGAHKRPPPERTVYPRRSRLRGSAWWSHPGGSAWWSHPGRSARWSRSASYRSCVLAAEPRQRTGNFAVREIFDRFGVPAALFTVFRSGRWSLGAA